MSYRRLQRHLHQGTAPHHARLAQPGHGAGGAGDDAAAVRLRAEPGRGPHPDAGLRPGRHRGQPRPDRGSFRARAISRSSASWTATRAIERGHRPHQILMGVVIPRDYSQNIGAGPRGAGADSAGRQRFQHRRRSRWATPRAWCANYSLQLRTDMQNRRGGEHGGPPVDARLRVWYNSSLESKNYVVPGLIAVILQIIAALLTSLTIAREWEMGTMEQVLSTPLRPGGDGAGQDAGVFRGGAGGCGHRACWWGCSCFSVPLRGSLLLLAVSTVRVSVRRAVLGHLRFGGGQDAVAGVPDGHSEFVPAGVSAFRICVLHRDHAAR